MSGVGHTVLIQTSGGLCASCFQPAVLRICYMVRVRRRRAILPRRGRATPTGCYDFQKLPSPGQVNGAKQRVTHS